MIQDCIANSLRRNDLFDRREREKLQVQAAAFYSQVYVQMQSAQSRGRQLVACSLLG